MCARALKCYGNCNLKYQPEELVQFQGKNFCKSCYESKMKEITDREALYDYIKKVFNINYPTGLMLRQIKDFNEQRRYTYKNIRMTIDYITRIKKKSMQLQYGIALVPHFYDEMIRYYKELKERRDKTKDIVHKVRTVKVKPFVLTDEYKQSKLVDMSKWEAKNERS